MPAVRRRYLRDERRYLRDEQTQVRQDSFDHSTDSTKRTNLQRGAALAVGPMAAAALAVGCFSNALQVSLRCSGRLALRTGLGTRACLLIAFFGRGTLSLMIRTLLLATLMCPAQMVRAGCKRCLEYFSEMTFGGKISRNLTATNPIGLSLP